MADPYANDRGWWSEALVNITDEGQQVELELGGWNVVVTPKGAARGAASFTK